MMVRRLVGMVILVIPVGAVPALGIGVTVEDLVERGPELAGLEVTVVGEFVGDYGNRRDGFTWTQINGDSYADTPILEGGPLTGSNVGVGVRFATELTKNLDPPGGYLVVGPIVEVTGIWKYHDPGRSGESYLEVTSLTVVAPGRALSEPPNWIVYGLGMVLLVGAATLMNKHRNARSTRERGA